MVGVYNFLQKVLIFIRDSTSKNNIQNDISLVDDLIQRANSMALEAHIMAHDSGVTATELFTHLHMLRRRSVLESPAVDLPHRKWQDYVYIQCEYKSTKQKIKHLLREENKVKENKIS